MDPLIILAIGIATVLGLILCLRVHAFLAMVVAAMIVSLLAPGPIATKIQRVAESFGGAAGNIAIVIALAAIIGECMLVSGAADRIVQAFLRVLGERRASWALMGSGYVLAIPVFFDTVFYLLVPLARSLYRRTNRNYLLYLMAIAGGGAITHTLVPPTPGPLVMAATLGIDMGLMILVGAIVAIPAAIAGLIFSTLVDRWMPVPFREDKIVENEDDVSQVPSVTPSLLLSMLPVLLPVLLISANTALTSLANNEGTARLTADQVLDWNFLAESVDESPAVAGPRARLLEMLPQSEQELLASGAPLSPEQQQQVLTTLNQVLGRKSPALYDAAAFKPVLQTPEAGADDSFGAERRAVVQGHLRKDPQSLTGPDREQLNRLLLELAFPNAIAPHTWQTPLRSAADLSSLLGNPNLALLFSALVAMFLVWKVKGTSLKGLSELVESSLMSGGTIILITAAGGAFGAMLKAAGIGDAIRDQFMHERTLSGLMFLILGYSVSALMKVAQGSSTVSMITVSGMLAAMTSEVKLDFHPVYLAVAIGSGSLMGSWMNDSGFWIFAKMGRLTESEALRSWTFLLMVLSLTSFAVTLLLARLVPLV